MNELRTANDVHAAGGASLTELVTGIVNDAQELMRQQLALLRSELQESSRKTKQAAILLVVGAGVLALGGLMAAFALVYLLAWAAPSLPLWACYLIVGVPMLLAGGGLFASGTAQLRSTNLLPDQSTQALKENWQWLRNPK